MHHSLITVQFVLGSGYPQYLYVRNTNALYMDENHQPNVTGSKQTVTKNRQELVNLINKLVWYCVLHKTRFVVS